VSLNFLKRLSRFRLFDWWFFRVVDLIGSFFECLRTCVVGACGPVQSTYSVLVWGTVRAGPCPVVACCSDEFGRF